MKTEQHLNNEISKLKSQGIPALQAKLYEAIENEEWDDALEACFSLTVNIAALEAAQRVVE